MVHRGSAMELYDESLVGVEEALLGVGGEDDAVGGDFKAVAFVAQLGVEGVVHDELHDALLVVTDEVGLDAGVAERVEDVLDGVGVLSQAGDGDGDIVFKEESLLALFDGYRLGYDFQVGDIRSFVAGGGQQQNHPHQPHDFYNSHNSHTSLNENRPLLLYPYNKSFKRAL